MDNKLIRVILDKAFEKGIIGFGTFHVGVRALNRRKKIGHENDWTKEIALIELTEEVNSYYIEEAKQ